MAEESFNYRLAVGGRRLQNPPQLDKDHLNLNFVNLLSLLPSISLYSPELWNPEVCNVLAAPFFFLVVCLLVCLGGFLQLKAIILQG